MATVSQPEVAVAVAAPRTPASRAIAAAEALTIFAACQIFLWKYSRIYHRGWILILAFMVGSIIVRGKAHSLGLSFTENARGAARWMVAGMFPVCAIMLISGAIRGRIALVTPDRMAFVQFGGYALWCVMQQFALQSYMHNRLLEAISNPHITALIVGIMFGALHIPNPTLVIATLFGGIAMAEVFARYRNIWILALGQALVATCIMVALPVAWHHRLRVGPGYYWWEAGK